jgi:hypothetical protein
VTNQPPFSRRGTAMPSIPKGDVLGTYETYEEAQRIVDKLAKADFDVRQLSIIGNDLKTIERVTGKLTYGRSALGGAATGAWLGMFAGLLLLTFSGSANLTYAIAVVVIGAAFGMLWGVVRYAANRQKRDFTSTHQVVASSYQVIAPPSVIVRAQELLQRTDEA